MNINFNIELQNDEIDQLAGILGCTNEELPTVIAPYAKAALDEYIKMFIGQKVFTRAADFREYRLFLLIEHVFDNEIPNEQQISALFQTTANQSRTLTRSIMSKYQYDLAKAIKKSFRKVITNAKFSEDDDCYLIIVDNENIIEALNGLIRSIDGTLPPIQKKTNTVSTYKLEKSSRKKIMENLGIEIEEEVDG